MRTFFAGLVTSALVLGAAPAQDEAFKSGPPPGTVLPGPFDVFVINGKLAAGRQHCLVCQNALNPAVLVFAREPAEGKDAALNDLLKKLDDAVERHQNE